MLKLTNISKYYHSNDVVALGLRKVNLEFKLGEFIAVTGESGSGKSTLLNVLSGLDTYEDGEMYVNGEETSYYSVEEWESYRRQYIGFVFQNYNIIDSYSVLENVMVALTIQGYPKEQIKERALELIDKVGLSTHIHHKASKLSGGQKQRAVIARALAKDCPIIVCDEPTGNLDSESSKNIMKLLEEIAKDKLVIVVTHNYDEVAEFATRKIRLFDGEVVEDKQINKSNAHEEGVTLANYNMSSFNLVGIALRNLFRTPRRTIFTTIIGIFIAIIFTFSYGSYMKNSASNINYMGYSYFENVSEKRIIVTKYDGSMFTAEELAEMEQISGVNYLLKHDVIMDAYLMTYHENKRNNYYYENQNYMNPAAMLRLGDLKEGRLPESKYEIVVEDIEDYKIGDKVKGGFEFIKWDGDGAPSNSIEFTIVGITNNLFPNDWRQRVYLHEDFLTDDEIIYRAYYSIWGESRYINNQFLVQNTENDNKYGMYIDFFGLTVDDTFADGEIKVSMNMANRICIENGLGSIFEEGSEECYKELDLQIITSSAFYTHTIDVEIVGTFEENDEFDYGMIYGNKKTTDLLFDRTPYQITLLVDDKIKAERVLDEFYNTEYNAMYPANATDDFSEMFQLIQNFGFGFNVVLLMVIIYFVSFAVLRNVQNAKKKDYLIFRSIGASKKDLNKVTLLELFFTMTMSYIITLILLMINEMIPKTPIPQYLTFFTVGSYLIIFALLSILALLLGRRFNKKIFSKSVITSLKQE